MDPLILYGGTFNPIHRGHLGICRQVHRMFPTGEILLMPAARPPHKSDSEVIAGEHRLAMCMIAAKDLPYVRVDSYELEQGGKSYTIDTLRHLKEQYPQRPLYLLMGTDMFLTFRKWKDWQGVGRMAVLLVASRVRDDRRALERAGQSLQEEGVRSIFLGNEVEEISSSQVRRQLEKERSCRLVPEGVLEYILAHQLYRQDGELAQERREDLRQTVKKLVSPERYAHTLAVEKQALHLAQRYGEDPQKAAECGILHDICKNMPEERMLQLIADDGIMTGTGGHASSDIPFERQPQLLHSYAGAAYLRLEMGITDEEILDAVRYHTTARGGMSRLEKIVYLADLTSEDRNYPDVDKVRKLAEESLEAAMKYSLQYIVGRLAREGGYLCRNTVEAFNEACGYPQAPNGGK